MNDSIGEIRSLFEPESVAVIGASKNESKIGFKILQNIIVGGFKGEVYPVNPQGGEILGKKVYTSAEEIGCRVDLATICVPAKFVFSALESLAKVGARYVSIITSGFSEVGNCEEEKKIVDFAKANNMRILGPNIFGVYSAGSSLNATFGPKEILAGDVAIVTQSGALGLAMIGKTAVENIGLSSIVSVGNKTDVDEADVLEYLMHHDDTKVIMLYLEGVSRGERFVAALKRATKLKPVVVIKSGRSKRGAMAAASHTGSLAGSDEVFDCIMKQCGAIRAESLKDAFDWCKFFCSSVLPKGNNAVIITNGGGIGVLATDASEKYGIELYDNAEEMKRIFADATPDFGSLKNPIDITGQATPEDYNSALKAALEDEHISTVMSLYCETAVFTAESLISVVEKNTALYAGKKPLVFCLVGGENTEQCITKFKREGAPVFSDVYEAVSCLGALYRQYENTVRVDKEPKDADIDLAKINAIVDGALADNRSFLLAHEGQAVMSAAGIRVPQSKNVTSVEQAVETAEGIGYPLVMKVVSRDILHKSDAGGVVLNIQNADEVKSAYESIMTKCRAYKADADIEGIEVVEMVKPGKELIVGARKDESFGPTVMVGQGGIYVEVMKDVTFRYASMSECEVRSMIESIKAYPLLTGVRGEAPSDVDMVVDAIVKLCAIIRKCDSITDIEINPVMVYAQGKGGMAVDVRVLIK